MYIHRRMPFTKAHFYESVMLLSNTVEVHYMKVQRPYMHIALLEQWNSVYNVHNYCFLASFSGLCMLPSITAFSICTVRLKEQTDPFPGQML